MSAISRRSLIATLHRVRRQRDQAIRMAARYKILSEQLTRGLIEVKAGLAENRELCRRYQLIDAAVRAEFDPMESTLQ